MKKILYLITEDSYFCSHRLDLAIFIKQQGYEVAVATKCSNHKEIILKHGFKLFDLKFFSRASYKNPFKEILALKELYTIYKAFKPDLVHHVALKPVVYGTIIAQLLGVNKIINALAGLGFIFTEANYKFWNNINIYVKQKILQCIVSKILQIIFNNKQQNKVLLLQNNDDLICLKKFVKFSDPKLTPKLVIISGSGIVMEQYLTVSPLNDTSFNEQKINIVLISRLLWTKGIAEFVEASKQIKELIKINNLNINPTFILYGDIDPKNPASVNYPKIKEWQTQQLIDWRHFCKDVREVYKDCHIAVLPSYQEGLPKTLLEAMACARAIVTTDVSGCKELVEEGVNGYLIPKQNSKALANVLLKLIQDQKLMINMGIASREKIKKQFSSEVIFPKFLELYS